MNQVVPVLLLYLASRVNSAPRIQKYDCATILYSPLLGGLEPSFPGVVAHGVHSLTLPDIHRYFPTTKEDIRMPVVNPDLLSQEPILFSPPDFQHSFHSPALQAVDRVLTHLGDPHYDMRLYTDLEKLVHAAHMQEVWQQAGKVYTDIQVLMEKTPKNIKTQAKKGGASMPQGAARYIPTSRRTSFEEKPTFHTMSG